MPVQQYSDLGKKAKDLLKDDFSFDRKVTIKNKSANGVNFTTEATLSKKPVAGKFTMKFKPVAGIEVKKLEFTSSDSAKGELILSDTGVDGLKVHAKVSATGGAKATESGSIQFKYGDASLSADAEVDVVNKDFDFSTSVNVSTAFDDFTFGAGVTVLPKQAALTNYGAAFAYTTSDVDVSMGSSDKFATVNVGYHQSVSSDVNFALTSTADVKKASVSKYGFGATCKLDSNASVAAKIDQGGVLSALYKQKYNPNTTFIACSSFNVNDLNAPPAFGLGLTFE